MFQFNQEYVGQMIRKAREQRGIQQKDLADKLKVSRSVINEIEGGTQRADIEQLVNISEVLNVRLEDLLGVDRDIDDDTHKKDPLLFHINQEYVGQMIQEVQEQRGIQQKDLADKLKVSRSVISKIEKGTQRADIEQLVNISEVLNVRLEYLLGMDRDIDDDTHIVNLFMKKFFRIITSKRFFGNKRVFAPRDFEDFFYSVDGQYVILKGPKRIFSLIKEVAKANGRGKEEQNILVEKALNKYREEKDEKTVGKYFLLSKDELQNLVKEYVKWEKAREEINEVQEYRNIEE